ncbi:PEP-CTERM sorting domain-containing protein [Uliginosibacterium sp. H3]|uniref:PEP-CTERM sorting domain-containing protein n=1 Tax=Uliginosibacterium silvisoli TaxID=3114758 RepID=A0ABU6K6V5_9RHOO|nr:PEP-CTERM sorting domain-containing protein [Uliginosibacterium sp. H3]
MKLKKFAATLAASVGLFASSVASASIIQADWNGAIGGSSFTTFDTIFLTPSPASYAITLDFGADGKFSTGDTFTETVSYKVVRTDLGATESYYNPADTWVVTATLQGVLTGVNLVADASIFNPASLANIFAAGSTWAAAFTGGSVSFVDADTAISVATATVLSGGSSQFFGNNSTQTLQFGIDARFDTVNDDYLRDGSGGLLSGYLPLLFGVADASANLDPTKISISESGEVVLVVKDNGGTAVIEIPEPASIALVGVALLGLGASSRRYKAKKTA